MQYSLLCHDLNGFLWDAEGGRWSFLSGSMMIQMNLEWGNCRNSVFLAAAVPETLCTMHAGLCTLAGCVVRTPR